jgi:hypothetical protein
MLSKITKILLYIVPALVVLLLSILLLKNSFSYSDLDLGWHLQAGSSIISNHQVSTLNQYNYTLENEAWLDHEWLPNALMAYIYSSFGSLALQFAFLALALVAIYLAWRRSLLLDNSRFNKYLSFIFLFIGIWASQPHLGLRVQELGLIGVMTLLIFIDNYPRKKYLLYFTPILFLFWANIHASFLLGLALLGLYCGYLYLAPYLIKLPFLKCFSLPSLKSKEKHRVLLILVLSLLFTLINPYGLQLYSFLGAYGNTFYMSYIREWQGQFSLPLYYPQIIYLSLSATGAIIWTWFGYKNKEKINLWDFGLFVMFFVLAWRSRRHFPLFVLVSLPLLILFYQETFKSIWQSFTFNIRVLILSFLALALLFSSILIAMYLPFNQHPINSFCGRQYPCAAVNYLKNHPEISNQRLFSEYNWGGYLIWSYPAKKIFIDGRMPQVLYKNHSILEEYLEFRKSVDKAQIKLDEYQINLVLIKNKLNDLQLKTWEKTLLSVKDEDLVVTDSLRDYLRQSDEWQLIFQDNLSLIYLRE